MKQRDGLVLHRLFQERIKMRDVPVDVQKLQQLHVEMKPLLRRVMPRMHAQDLQNCLCEFDKYERERLGEGHPKQRYPGLPSNSGRSVHA